MIRKTKSLLSLLLALCMIFTSLPIYVKADATPTASVANVTVIGVKDQELSPKTVVEITLADATFTTLTDKEVVTSWFEKTAGGNIGTLGLVAKIKGEVQDGAITAKVEISGTSNEVLEQKIKIVIPADKTSHSDEITVTDNAKAKYSITEQPQEPVLSLEEKVIFGTTHKPLDAYITVKVENDTFKEIDTTSAVNVGTWFNSVDFPSVNFEIKQGETVGDFSSEVRVHVTGQSLTALDKKLELMPATFETLLNKGKVPSFTSSDKSKIVIVAPVAHVVQNVTVNGTVGSEIADQKVVVEVTGDVFKEIPAGTRVDEGESNNGLNWFTNLPEGLTAILKDGVRSNQNIASITISGTPTQPSDRQIDLTVKKGELEGDLDLPLTRSDDAKFAIILPSTTTITLSQTGEYVFQSQEEGQVSAQEKEITITNTGYIPTEELTVELSGADAESFELESVPVTNIPDGSVGNTGTFKVKTKADLSAKEYTATVTVKGAKLVEQKSFPVKFVVTAPASAIVEDVEISGIKNTMIAEKEVVITVANDTFTAQNIDTDVSTWFTNKPAGLEFKLKEALSEGMSTVATVKVTGTPTAALSDKMAITIPAAFLTKNVQVAVTSNDEAKYAITEPVPPTTISLSQTDKLIFEEQSVGYQPVQAKVITITNTGTNSTGELHANLAGTNSDQFEITAPSPQTLASNNETSTFTVKPKDDLAQGTYVASVSVDGQHVGDVHAFAVEFTVTPAQQPQKVVIELSQKTPFVFDIKNPGYTPQEKTITIVNKDRARATGELTVDFSGGQTDAFIVKNNDSKKIASIHQEGEATFIISPKAGLGVGQYSTIVAVTGDGVQRVQPFMVSFEVKAAPAPQAPPSSNDSSSDEDSSDSGSSGSGSAGSVERITPNRDNSKAEPKKEEPKDSKKPETKIENKEIVQVIPELNLSISKETVEKIEKFEDVKTDSWYSNALSYAVERGIMNGVSETSFAPNEKTTRGQLVQIFYRLAGQPEAKATEAFGDVAKDAYYNNAVAWASNHNIVKGLGDGNFGSNENITREQLAVFLYRFAQSQNKNVSVKADLAKFTDNTNVSSWAQEALAWAVANNLVKGVSENSLDPKGSATRAQIATIMLRYEALFAPKSNFLF